MKKACSNIFVMVFCFESLTSRNTHIGWHMKLYLLEWYNGLEYSDAETVLLGIYSSEEERTTAEQRYADSDQDRWPFYSKCGKFVKGEIELNKDIL